MGALIALARQVVGPLLSGGARTAARFATRGGARSLALGAGGAAAFDVLDPFGGGDGGGVFGVAPRRRRRKALTDSDMKTALIIASSVSKKAAENFILTRTRSG